MTIGELKVYVKALSVLINNCADDEVDTNDLKEEFIITRSYKDGSEVKDLFKLQLIKSEIQGGTGSKMHEENKFMFTCIQER